MDKYRTAKLCTIGLGGHSVEYAGHCRCSGYCFSPEEVAQSHASELTEGVLLLDKRHALNRSCGYAFASPMVNVDAEPGEVDDFTTRYLNDGGGLVMDAMRQFGQTATIIKAAEIASEHGVSPGPLDYVDTLTYCKWWVDRGAVLYRYDGTQFILT